MLKKELIRLIKDKRGFTLMELLVTVAIIGVLSTIIVGTAIGYIKKSQANADEQSLIIYNQLLKDTEFTTDEEMTITAVKKMLSEKGHESISPRQNKKVYVWNKAYNRVEIIGEDFYKATATFNIDWLTNTYYISYGRVELYLLSDDFMDDIYMLKTNDALPQITYEESSIFYKFINIYLNEVRFYDGTSNYRRYYLNQEYTTETTKPTYLQILEGVQKISSKAFNRSKIINVRFPTSLKEIGTEAFARSSSLTTIIFNRNSNITTIKARAFSYCTALQNVDFASPLEVIEDEVFLQCKKLINISLPSSLKSMGNGVFRICSNIEKINVDIENEHFTVLDNVLYSIDKKTLYFYPPQKKDETFVIPIEVENIQGGAFSYPQYLEELYMENNVRNVGTYFLESAKVLKSVILSNHIKTLSAYTFYNCEKLDYVILSSYLHTIENECFTSCKALNKLFIPKSTLVITSKFTNCYSLVITTPHATAPTEWNTTFQNTVKEIIWNQSK